MLKERLAMANKVASELHEAEAALDLAIARMGVLVTSLPAALASSRLSSVVGDTGFGHLQGAVTHLFAGRAEVVALHNELASVKDRMGLRNFVVVGTGDLGKLVPGSGAALEVDDVVASSEAEAA